MNVVLDVNNYNCRVIREKTDPYFTDSGWSNAESVFLYHVKKELIKRGYDVIKKRMYKDGHLVDNFKQYIRSRKLDDKAFCIFNDRYDIVSAGAEFNEYGEFDLYVCPLT